VARAGRQPIEVPTQANARWSMDFMRDALADGGMFRNERVKRPVPNRRTVGERRPAAAALVVARRIAAEIAGGRGRGVLR